MADPAGRGGHRLGGVLRLQQQHLARPGEQLDRPRLYPGALQQGCEVYLLPEEYADLEVFL